ncbi:MAG: twin-arginine translocation pathway signal protein [Comamonadaceae bacterium CG_4_9_14_3_um_filter_60_33]|nr:MAG: twin-arginine translocation pathway signal protein [Comamonadaceae bacterium CG2_30_59_20]PIY29705.1 MAG: twin-arginine translocation pathway signal protein [Comamonadaceae bacterium CG_4_10_14_3_um_filter_60_42]PJB43536.1 MAG: twin-arginine translocation pathway signal protein [Comamonadaceae bacterium CG_4_9_14_3_um_filter_60_33]
MTRSKPISLQPSRRFFLHRSAQAMLLGGALGLAGKSARASAPSVRSLMLDHTHTHERINLVYASGDHYVPQALGTLNRFLRDHYSGEVGQIDPQLFDLLHNVHQALGSGVPLSYQIISGYRGPLTNARLRSTRGGGVAKHSLHMEGKAIDVRLPGVPLAELRDAALSLKAGGVGYYPRDQFVHIDTGRVRSW